MSKKLDNYSVPELVGMFAGKWNLEIIDRIELCNKLPVIVQEYSSSSASGYSNYKVYFKGALSRVTSEKLSKKVLISPDRYLNKYQLKQLVAAVKGEFYECGS